MVRALIEGRKFQTRRILKPQPVQNVAGLWVWPPVWAASIKRYGVAVQTDEAGLVQALMYDPARCVGYAPGDRLWVKEAWRIDGAGSRVPAEMCRLHRAVEYRADGYEPDRHAERSPIFMPRWASRLTLAVTDVRVQRLQDMTEADARAEGIMQVEDGLFDYHEHAEIRFKTAKAAFCDLWNSLHGPSSWGANPWVVALTLEVHHGNIDAVRAKVAG